MREIIIALASGLLGSLIGGLIAIYGGIMVVRRTEYYRLRLLLKNTLQNTILKVGQHNFPWVLIPDDVTDDLVRDILQVMLCHVQNALYSSKNGKNFATIKIYTIQYQTNMSNLPKLAENLLLKGFIIYSKRFDQPAQPDR